MRAGLIASLAGHTALLLWGLIAFPDAESFPEPVVDSLPVDIVSLSELTEIQKGERDGQQDVPPAPKPAERPKPEPPEPAEAPSPEPQPQAETPPPPTPSPAPAPAPAPPQETPAPAAEPEPAPQAAPEPAPAEPAEPAPQPDPEPAPAAEPQPQQAAPEPQRIVTNVVPRSKPTPPVRAPEQPQRETQVTENVDLLNKINQALQEAPASQEPASVGTRAGNDHAGLTANEKDIIAQLIRDKWSRLPDQYPPDLKVVLRFRLSPEGKLMGAPTVENSYPDPRFQALASSAVRAVYRVEAEGGFAILPSEKYSGSNGWNTMQPSLYPNG